MRANGRHRPRASAETSLWWCWRAWEDGRAGGRGGRPDHGESGATPFALGRVEASVRASIGVAVLEGVAVLRGTPSARPRSW